MNDNKFFEDEHENLVKIAELLEVNEFSASYRKKIIEGIKKELQLGIKGNFFEVQQQVLKWIGESIIISDEHIKADSPPEIAVLFGPTGAGKTTTIVKLALAYIFSLKEKIIVRLVNTDKYRTGAEAQLSAWAEAMDAQFQSAGNDEDLKIAISFEEPNIRLILIDTIGRSPWDTAGIVESQKVLSVCPENTMRYLVIDAKTKSSDIIEIITRFEPLLCKSLIITKLDETERCGNVISAISEMNKPVSFVTFGREYNNINKASVMCFLDKLTGFQFDRDRFEKKFGRKN